METEEKLKFVTAVGVSATATVVVAMVTAGVQMTTAQTIKTLATVNGAGIATVLLLGSPVKEKD